MVTMITMMTGAMKAKETELHVLSDIYSSVVCSTFLLIIDITQMVTAMLPITLAKWMGILCNAQDQELVAYAIFLAKWLGSLCDAQNK